MEELKPVSMLVRNERGVLARIAGLFARRGFNITSLAVGETENPAISRITVVVGGDLATLEQVVKQAKRQVCVHSVQDLSRAQRVERGLAMIKVRATPANRHEIANLVSIFNGCVDHVDHQCMIVELSANRDKIQAMLDVLKPYGIIEMARTGQIVLDTKSSLPPQEETAAPRAGSGAEKKTVRNLKTA